MLKKYENLYLIFAYLNFCFTHRGDNRQVNLKRLQKELK